MSFTSVSELTSAIIAIDCLPAARITFATASSLSLFAGMSLTATFRPSFASRMAIARPIPVKEADQNVATRVQLE